MRLLVLLLCLPIVLAAPSDISITGNVEAADYQSTIQDTPNTLPNSITGSAGDLSCTDCIGPTEINDEYVRNTGGDTVSGNLIVTSYFTPSWNCIGTGANDLCKNTGDVWGNCGSSIVYKEDVRDLSLGLSTLMQLRPRTFIRKGENTSEIGFIAEEAEEIDPVFIIYEDGEVQGYKYRQTVALAFQSLQRIDEQNEDLERRIESARERIRRLQDE